MQRQVGEVQRELLTRMQQHQQRDDDNDDDDGDNGVRDPTPAVGVGGSSSGLGGSSSSGVPQGSAGSRPAVFDQMMSDIIPQLRSAIRVPSAASTEEATSLGDDEAWSSEEDDDGSSDLEQDLDLEGMPELVDDGKVRASTLYSDVSPLEEIVTDDSDDSPNHLR